MTGFLTGTATALVTPFTQDAINFEAFGNLIENQIANGVNALIVLGTTGEPATMTEEEKQSVISYAIEKVAKRVKILIGTGSNCMQKAIEASKRAEALGADGVLCVTPYYNKCTQTGIYKYYKQICETVDIPVVCYNVPGRTGVNILPETMAHIAEIPNVAGIKEASGNMAQVMETARLIRGKCDLYSGEDALNLPIYAAGGKAVISVVSNVAPALVCALSNACLKGDYALANEINDKLQPLTKACFCEVNPIPAKAALNYLGFNAGEPRSPLTPLEEGHEAMVKNALRSCGLEVIA